MVDTSFDGGSDAASLDTGHDAGAGDVGDDDASASDAGRDPGPSPVDATDASDIGAMPDATTDTGSPAHDAGDIVPLFSASTTLDPPLQLDTGDALITRFADRARDRHAREDEFQAYDHYLPFYWEHRTTTVEIVDTVGHGGDTITFNVTTQWPLREREAELRFFYRGIGTVAEYFDNGVMTALGDNAYTRSVSRNAAEGRELRVGDRMEFELSQFLDAPPRGRVNYYGTTFLYVVGEGIVPWEARGTFGDFETEREDSFPIPREGWLGGGTTLSYAYSNEPESHLLQMATNLAPAHGQTFVLGRRVHHTRMTDGTHSESAENPVFTDLVGRVGRTYINDSCVSCHANNGRGLPPAVGAEPTMYVVRTGTADGGVHPTLGAVLQPRAVSGEGEGRVTLERWDAVGDLRAPVWAFEPSRPEGVSVRVAPPLIGMGLLEAIDEADILALADPDDRDGDGISGRPRIVTDPETGDLRLGRFGWKADRATVRQQVAGALNTDMGVMSSVFAAPDCGPDQTGCDAAGSEIADTHLDHLTAYVSLLGIRARRDLDAPVALDGERRFEAFGCASCHTPGFVTSSHAPFAELRDQTIWPYTDLLLHDMGPGLADSLPDGNAGRAEWRTAPLWGIGLTEEVSGQGTYLHDGRARTLDEAIRWHGDEASDARDAYEAATPAAREALIAFLRSL